MPKTEIEDFAKNLVESVRDAAIRSCDQQTHSNMKSPVAKRWRSLKEVGTVEDLQKAMIVDCVDEAVFFLLQAIDQGLLDIAINTKDGKPIRLTEDGLGELAGWYMGSGGWRAQYSNERFIDDFSDLA